MGMQVVVALLVACLVLLVVPHASAVSNQRSEVQAHMEAEGIFDWFGEQLDVLQSAATDTYLRFEKSTIESLKEFRERVSCQSTLPTAETLNHCQVDQGAETRLFLKEGQAGLHTTKSMRSETWFWADAARQAKLARYAYNTNLHKPRRTDVHMLEVFEGFEAGADAFISVRSSASPTFKKLHTEQGPFGNDILEAFHKEQQLKWKGMKEEGPPAAVEVVVRGTSEMMDGLINAYATKTEFKVTPSSDYTKEISLGEVHSGFYKQYEALRDPIRKALLPFLPAIRSGKTLLYFSGHSLGGAVAQLLAMDIVTHYGLKRLPYKQTIYNKDNPFPTMSAVRVYTFGAPRVGDGRFSFVMRVHTFHVRFKFMGDVVPEVPLKGMGYKHGDTYAVGLSVVVDAVRPVTIGNEQFFAYCIAECSPVSTIIKQVLASHTMDWSYQQSIEGLLLSTLNRGTNPFLEVTDQRIFGLLQLNSDNNEASLDLLAHMRCRGNHVCVREVRYPGAKEEDLVKCTKELAKNNIHYDSAVYGNMILSQGQPSIRGPTVDAKQVEVAVQYRDRYMTAFSNCMKPYTDETYYDALKPSDFMMADGDVYMLKYRRLIHIGCYMNAVCILHMKNHAIEYDHLTSRDWEICQGDMECIERKKDSRSKAFMSPRRKRTVSPAKTLPNYQSQSTSDQRTGVVLPLK